MLKLCAFRGFGRGATILCRVGVSDVNFELGVDGDLESSFPTFSSKAFFATDWGGPLNAFANGRGLAGGVGKGPLKRRRVGREAKRTVFFALSELPCEGGLARAGRRGREGVVGGFGCLAGKIDSFPLVVLLRLGTEYLLVENVASETVSAD